MKTVFLAIASLAVSGFIATAAPESKDHKNSKECIACCKSADKCDACCHDKGKGVECKACCFDEKKK